MFEVSARSYINNSSSFSDENLKELISKIKEGDEKAFKEFFMIFYEEILRFLYFYVWDEEIAKDLAQDVFINFWKARNRIDIFQNPKGYLYRIARNIAINHIERRKKEYEIDEVTIKNITQMPDGESFELRDTIIKAINELPDRCKEVFILSRYTGLSQKEIADLLGISLQTVKNHIVKAMNYLRKRLSSYLKE